LRPTTSIILYRVAIIFKMNLFSSHLFYFTFCEKKRVYEVAFLHSKCKYERFKTDLPNSKNMSATGDLVDLCLLWWGTFVLLCPLNIIDLFFAQDPFPIVLMPPSVDSNLLGSPPGRSLFWFRCILTQLPPSANSYFAWVLPRSVLVYCMMPVRLLGLVVFVAGSLTRSWCFRCSLARLWPSSM
jgi:hypothetical protein